MTNWIGVATGESDTCAVNSDGELYCWGLIYCWGQPSTGQLGSGTIDWNPSPFQVGAAADWTDVATGEGHTCGVRAGVLYCWGANLYGERADAGQATVPKVLAPGAGVYCP